MRKPKPLPSKDEPLHPVGQERFVNIRVFVGDIPADEPVDWLEQSDEFEPDRETDWVNDERIWDEW